MALANVAWILATNGRRVLVIDWDLEAPGLHRFFRPFLLDKELRGPESQGVIEFFRKFMAKAATPPLGDERLPESWYAPLADIGAWKTELRWPMARRSRSASGAPSTSFRRAARTAITAPA